LAVPRERIDVANRAIVFKTLKRRNAVVYRAVLVPPNLMALLRRVHNLDATDHDPKERLWKWGRTTAWKRVKRVMKCANIGDLQAMPKAARHAFAVEAGQRGIPLKIVQRWLGHARLETAAIYASAIGEEERNLARRAWASIERAIPCAARQRLVPQKCQTSASSWSAGFFVRQRLPCAALWTVGMRSVSRG
jgi:integrase